MISLKATYDNTSNGKHQVIEVPHDSDVLTDSVNKLKDQINSFLTHVLEIEKQGNAVPTVEQDQIENEKENEEEEEEDNSPMTANKPDFEEEKATKKLKMDS
ncbi:uncharacterized protein BX663DRAFT_500149 [Cokeromyces recurvatus]|uniref:uncharacterized protein n=1 Tax=Cokeromyces recurvatus TaxID=90255 RepID=UPI00221EA047|nr:uncharacterized protein BX663DRAFT_500149 [Cokeromyces recurvatus]KAI7905560.1 hypothetical protein BX663DRAFT_500149 [Cokeromyces recurvatus]